MLVDVLSTLALSMTTGRLRGRLRLIVRAGEVALSLTHVRARQAHTYPYDDDGAAAQAARSHSKGRGGDEGRWGPLRLPWGGVGPLARLLQKVIEWSSP